MGMNKCNGEGREDGRNEPLTSVTVYKIPLGRST